MLKVMLIVVAHCALDMSSVLPCVGHISPKYGSYHQDDNLSSYGQCKACFLAKNNKDFL